MLTRRCIFARFSIVVIAALACAATAQDKPHGLFGDNMVLQRGMPIPVWGTSSPNETVTVRIANRSGSTQADETGKWKVVLDAMPAGGPHELSISAERRITFSNVMIGEVWICSGQSNMTWTVKNSANPDEEIAAADHPNIRLFTVPRQVSGQPELEVEGLWSLCSPETVAGFSAVAYYFGRELQSKLDVPIGLIHTSWGGTPAESWTAREILEADENLKGIVVRWDKLIANHPQAMESYRDKLEKWEQAGKQEGQDKEKRGRKPRAPMGPNHTHRASGLYNGMIHPLIPFAIRGAIWYQGESNAGRAYQYRTLFPAMITDWRNAWGQGDFPFLFVQLANFGAVKSEPGDSAWAELREAQLMTLELPATGMAVAIDIGDARNIHPKNKQEVGRRLALAARKIAYRNPIAHSGPMCKSVGFKGGKAFVTFDQVAGGLTVRGSEKVEGFAIAGEDRHFYWADAEISGKKLVLSSKFVPRPIAVRYGWADNPQCNLYDASGLPASPFRTDSWPGVTENNR